MSERRGGQTAGGRRGDEPGRRRRTLAATFALVVVAETVAQSLGVVYPTLLGVVPAWRGSGLLVGSVLAFGVGVGGTSALYARWTDTAVGVGRPSLRRAAPVVAAPVGVLAVAAVAGVETRLGPTGEPTATSLVGVVVGPALAAAVGYGLLYAVVGERARPAVGPTLAPVVVTLAGAVVVAVPLRVPVGAPIGSAATLGFVVTVASVVALGAVAVDRSRLALTGLVALVVGAGVVAGVAAVPVLLRLFAVGCAAVGYERTRTVVTPVAVLAAFRVAAGLAG